MLKQIIQIYSVVGVLMPASVQAMEPIVESMEDFTFTHIPVFAPTRIQTMEPIVESMEETDIIGFQKKLYMTSEALGKNQYRLPEWQTYHVFDILTLQFGKPEESQLENTRHLLKTILPLTTLKSLTIISEQTPDANAFSALIPLRSLKKLELKVNDKRAIESNADLVVISRFLSTVETLSIYNKATGTNFFKTYYAVNQ